MSEGAELILSYNVDVIAAAKKMKPKKYCNVFNVDMRKRAIKYKRMSPRIIAARLKRTITEDKFEKLDAAQKADLEALHDEMVVAADYNETNGMFRLIDLTTTQSSGTIEAMLIAYGLYEFNGKAVCDMVFIQATQQTSFSMKYFGMLGGSFLLAVAVPGIGLPELLSAIGAGIGAYSYDTAVFKSNAAALLMRTLKDYGFVEFLDDNKIKLIAD